MYMYIISAIVCGHTVLSVQTVYTVHTCICALPHPLPPTHAYVYMYLHLQEPSQVLFRVVRQIDNFYCTCTCTCCTCDCEDLRPAICVARAWHAIPTLPVTPVQLVRPGIGWNASCTLGGLRATRGLGSCGSQFIHVMVKVQEWCGSASIGLSVQWVHHSVLIECSLLCTSRWLSVFSSALASPSLTIRL